MGSAVSGAVEAHEIEEKVEEAANLRKLRSEGKMSDEEWERLQLKYQKIGLGMGSNESTISCTQLLKFMDESGSLTWKVCPAVHPSGTGTVVDSMSVAILMILESRCASGNICRNKPH